jgi:hypothetical protein
MSEKSEFARGYKAGKEHFDEYRSFKFEGDELYGYHRETGSKRMFGTLAHWSARKGFSGGYYKALKEAIKAKPTKTRKTTTMKKPMKMYSVKRTKWKW